MSASATAKSLQSCPTLCNPIDSSLPGSPVRFETKCLALCEAAAFVLAKVFSSVSLVKSRQYFPRDCSFPCCCPTELLRAWPHWKTRFSRAVSRDSLAFWIRALWGLEQRTSCCNGLSDTLLVTPGRASGCDCEGCLQQGVQAARGAVPLDKPCPQHRAVG